MNKKRLISIVVPVFNESEVIAAFYARMKKVVDSLNSILYEIIFIDDGSKDDSYDRIKQLAHADHNVKIIKFSRNFGHQIAITAGIDIAKGDAVVVIDSDLQDPPEVIKEFINKWLEGYDVVYGVREKREGESKMKLFTASIFYRILKVLTKVDIPVDTGDFRLMSRRAVSRLRELREHDRFIRGLVSWIGFKQDAVYYHRHERYAGETKYPYRKMIKFAFDGVISFSQKPLKIALNVGFLAIVVGILMVIYVFLGKLFFPHITVPGWASILIAVVFFGGVQLFTIGIIGEYIGRIFDETKNRPLYIVEDEINFKE